MEARDSKEGRGRPQRYTRAIVAETFDLQHFVYRLRARPIDLKRPELRTLYPSTICNTIVPLRSIFRLPEPMSFRWSASLSRVRIRKR